MESEKQLDPLENLSFPLQSATGEILHNRDKQIGRWVRHFSLLYSKDNTATDAALKHMENIPTMDDLETKPTVEELSKAITEMAFWKAPGSDGIPADLFRQCKSYLLLLLHEILVKCWREGDTRHTFC